jgi:hypothetical protein
MTTRPARTNAPRKSPPVWKIARGARGPGEFADRVVRLLAVAVVVAIVAYISWILIKHFSREFEMIRKPYESALRIRALPQAWRSMLRS